MKVPFLPPHAYVEFREPGPPGGHNRTNHLAMVRDKSGKPRRCFVKIIDPVGVACEAVGWLLAKSAGVACSEFGAVLVAPLDKIRKGMKLPAHLDGVSQTIAWCSWVVGGNTVMQINRWETEVESKACLASKDARVIAAFDQWTDLRDRNYGNVIKQGNGRYVSIDHESVLHDVLCVPAGRTFQERSLLATAEQTLDAEQLRRFKLDMRDASTVHEQAVQAASAAVDDAISKLYSASDAPNVSAAVRSALTSRSQQGWMANRLQVIP